MDFFKMMDLSIREFIEKLSSKSPTPGGGAVAALNALFGVSLLMMVTNITIANKNYEDVREEAQGILKDLSEIQGNLFQGPKKDAQSFDQVIRAFKLKKDTEAEKIYRSEKIQEGYKIAAKAPYDFALEVEKLFPYCKRIEEIGVKSALSDVKLARKEIISAIEGSIENIEINLKSIKDQDFVSDMREKIKRIKIS
ncbi:formiminotetrahydrofolate cyclodeaminase [Peptoniphilus koenoeneniae]|uniref:Formiminotetrahydrofolate cyclodeaminase n=1 Tax=Peptoniphilus koenoeneniae TaxID=507751 RepID=A0ABU0AXK9_9FIRM|nr:cyclodeaminase/cyclohydrolase family protein [Peptoniphilus koenoeneniae]MDQ0275527.1 formiminotetrahydrofolate cyclodeaminase [Peptoniphilus koenoeneniae]